VDSLGSPVIIVTRLPISWTSSVILGTSCFHGNWVEDVRAGQFIVLDDFVGRCLVGRLTCLCGSVANVIYYYYYLSCCWYFVQQYYFTFMQQLW